MTIASIPALSNRKDPMKRVFQTTLVLAIVLTMGAMVNAGDLKVCPIDPTLAVDVPPDIVPPASPKGTDDYWVGTVRVFLIEPWGRQSWTDSQGFPYMNVFLDFPIVNNVNLDDGDVRYFTAEWDAADATFLAEPMIIEVNIEAIAVAFNITEIPTAADPPNDYWFNARYADAAAGATPGTVGRNSTAGGFTHTVFLEESTATW